MPQDTALHNQDVVEATAFSLVDGDLADRLRRLELFSRFRVEGVLNGPNKSPYRGFSTDFLQHRQYYPGDNLKHLDWRVYGRSGRLMVRQYEEFTNARLRVILDASGSMQHQGDAMRRWEFAVRAAAILLYVGFLHRDSLSLSTFFTHRRNHVPCAGGKGQLLRCYRQLLAEEASGETDFEEGLNAALAGSRHRGLTVVLSDFMAAPDAIAKRLARLRFQGSDVIAMQIVDPSETDLDFNTRVRFHDLEGPEVLVVDPQLMRRAYREAFAEHTLALKSACERYGFQHVQLMVQDQFDVPILEYLRWRMETLQ